MIVLTIMIVDDVLDIFRSIAQARPPMFKHLSSSIDYHDSWSTIAIMIVLFNIMIVVGNLTDALEVARKPHVWKH